MAFAKIYELAKNCLLTTTQIVCAEKRQSFANISLIVFQIWQPTKGKRGITLWHLQLPLTMLWTIDYADIMDIAQLAILIRGVDASLSITEDVFGSLVGIMVNA